MRICSTGTFPIVPISTLVVVVVPPLTVVVVVVVVLPTWLIGSCTDGGPFPPTSTAEACTVMGLVILPFGPVPCLEWMAVACVPTNIRVATPTPFTPLVGLKLALMDRFIGVDVFDERVGDADVFLLTALLLLLLLFFVIAVYWGDMGWL